MHDRDTTSQLPEVLTVDEAAELLRCDRKTLYGAIKRGAVPGTVQVGRSVRIGRDALLQWLGAKHSQGSR